MSNKYGHKRTIENSNRPKKYKVRKSDETGKTGKEAKVMTSFWKEYTVEEIMTKSQEELEVIVNDFIAKYEAKNLKTNPGWWYPEDPGSHARVARRANKNSKYQADTWG